MTFRPYPYQKEGALQIERWNGVALLSDEMGLGKSFTTLLYAKWHPEKRPIVIVCPAVIKYHWEREASTKFGMRATVLETRKAVDLDPELSPIVIINYDILAAWLPKLLAMRPQILIADECHALCNGRTRRTRAMKVLSRNVPHRIFISGTPLVNRPAELWSVLNMLRPDMYPTFYPFAERFTNPRMTRWGFDYSGAANLPVLHREMKSTLLIRRLKSEVMGQLPPKTRVMVPVEIEDRKEYEKAYNHFLQWLAKNSYARMNKAMQAQYLARITYVKALLGRLKRKAITDWVRNFLDEDGGKLIGFGVHHDLLQPLHAAFPGSVLVNGQVTGRDRQGRIDRFNRDKDCRLFLGNIKAAGVGWSCKSTSNGAFFELAWAPAHHTQAEDRLHGANRGIAGVPATWYYLVAKDTIEEKHCLKLQKKQAVLDGTLDGGKGDGLELFDDLNGELLRDAELRGYR